MLISWSLLTALWSTALAATPGNVLCFVPLRAIRDQVVDFSQTTKELYSRRNEIIRQFKIFWYVLALSGTAERRLLGDLLEYYQKFERPVANEADAIQLKFGLSYITLWCYKTNFLGLTLQQIMDVDEKNQILTTNIWLNLVSETSDKNEKSQIK